MSVTRAAHYPIYRSAYYSKLLNISLRFSDKCPHLSLWFFKLKYKLHLFTNLKSYVAGRRPGAEVLNGALPPPRRPAPLRLLTGERKWRPPMCSAPGQSAPLLDTVMCHTHTPAGTLSRAPRRHLHYPPQPNTVAHVSLNSCVSLSILIRTSCS